MLGTLAAIVRDEPPALDAARIPPAVRQVVKRALEKNPEARYASGGELASALAAVSRAVAPRGALNRRWLAAGAAAVVVAAVLGGWNLYKRSRVDWARREGLPQIARLLAEDKGLAAFDLAQQVAALIPGDPNFQQAWAEAGPKPLVQTEPEGAEVYIRELGADEKPWRHVGTSPIMEVPLPRGYFLWQAVKPGFAETTGAAPTWWSVVSLRLAPEGEVPDGMVLVPGGRFSRGDDRHHAVEAPHDPYFIDRHEVTNRQFKQFVDQGGYQKREYWKTPFVRDGKPVSWDDAMAVFRDTTGRPGPSTWEGGTFPTGKDDFPVSGVSWYEAAAYAQFAGKSLPTISHWYLAADIRVSPLLIPASNFGGKGLAKVGSYPSIGPFGTYDMAGNAQEWTWNETDDGFRFILGGAWSSPTYQFNQPDAKPPFDRGPANGFRCALYPTPPRQSLLGPVRRTFRDYSLEKPVGDEAFRVIRGAYAYAPRELKATVDEVDDSSPYWRKEKVSFSAAYGDERVPAFVFLPKNAKPPYQALVYQPQRRRRVEHVRQHGWLQPYGIHHSQRAGGDLSDLYRDLQPPPPAHDVGDPAEGAICQEVPGPAADGRVPGESQRHRRFEAGLFRRECGSRGGACDGVSGAALPDCRSFRGRTVPEAGRAAGDRRHQFPSPRPSPGPHAERAIRLHVSGGQFAEAVSSAGWVRRRRTSGTSFTTRHTTSWSIERRS